MSIQLPSLNSPLEQLKEFAHVEFIITDLDGTLIHQGMEVFGQFLGLQRKLGKLNITITIATGRTLAGVDAIASKMQIKKGTPIALYNGAVVLSYQRNNVLYQKNIPDSVLWDLCELIDLNRQYILAYYLTTGEGNQIVETVHGFGRALLTKDVNGMNIIWHSSHQPETFVPHVGCAQNATDFMIFQYPFEPCSILIDKEVVSDCAEQLGRYLENCPLISCTSSGGKFWEIRAKGVNKGVIFPLIKKHNGDVNGGGSPEKRYIAVGDNDNDVELLQNADIGVVVANGSPAAMEAAQYHCEHGGVKGVLDLIRTIKEAKRYF